jgi:hypothetical protein
MGWLKGVLGFMSAPVTQWITNKGETSKAKHKKNLAIINNQSRLAQSEGEHNHEWEMESLKGNPPWLRVVCFIQIALPLNLSVINPELGESIWAGLAQVPDWYVQLYMIVIGSVWGIHEFKKAAPSVIAAVLGKKKG